MTFRKKLFGIHSSRDGVSDNTMATKANKTADPMNSALGGSLGSVDVNEGRDEGLTLLHRASALGQAKRIRELLHKGADVNALDISGRTPLDYAAGHRKAEYILRKAGGKEAKELFQAQVTSKPLADDEKDKVRINEAQPKTTVTSTATKSKSTYECDVCDEQDILYEPDGYCLTTKQVLSSPQFWERKLDLMIRMLKANPSANLSQSDVIQTIFHRIQQFADSATPWLVCQKCIKLFAVDQVQTREYAMQWWSSRKTFRPPGNGPIPVSSIQLFSDRHKVMAESINAILRKTERIYTFTQTRSHEEALTLLEEGISFQFVTRVGEYKGDLEARAVGRTLGLLSAASRAGYDVQQSGEGGEIIITFKKQ